MISLKPKLAQYFEEKVKVTPFGLIVLWRLRASQLCLLKFFSARDRGLTFEASRRASLLSSSIWTFT